MHKKIKGSLAELIVASQLIKKGWKILFPFGECNRYDLVAEKDGRFVRIQVKYVTPKNGALEINCKSSNNWSVLHYTSKEIDILAAYDSQSEKVYFIPIAKINRNSIKLRIHRSKNNQKLKINLAEDFLSLNII